jgi:hypothetical protein
MDSALQAYAEYLKECYMSRGASWAKSGFDRQLVVEFDKGSKFIKVILATVPMVCVILPVVAIALSC